jgi:hypothetical protein
MEPVRVLDRSQLLAAGWEASEIRRMTGTAQLVPLRRGVYASADPRLSEPRVLHLARVRAAARTMSDEAVVSHVSAAVVHGLDLWRADLSRVHLTRARGRGGRIGTDVHVTPAPLDADEVVEVSGVRVTSPARTLVDLARSTASREVSWRPTRGCGRGRSTPQRCSRPRSTPAGGPVHPAPGAWWRSRTGAARASASRGAGWRSPGPGCPHRVRSSRSCAGTGCWSVAATSGWDELGVVGEFDGRVKYGRDLAPGADAGAAVFAEKLREDALRDAGWEVARWVWADLRDFAPAAARIRRAMARAARHR